MNIIFEEVIAKLKKLKYLNFGKFNYSFSLKQPNIHILGKVLKDLRYLKITTNEECCKEILKLREKPLFLENNRTESK